MQQLGIDLKQHAQEIRRLWTEVLQEPPMRLPPDHDLGDLPNLIHDLIEVSVLHPHDVEAHEHKVALALRHGERHRQAGGAERLIYEEFAALREAIRRYLATCPVPRWKAREALVRLDMAISVAELAALHGYHRDSLERFGTWESVGRGLAGRSPLLGLPEP